MISSFGTVLCVPPNTLRATGDGVDYLHRQSLSGLHQRLGRFDPGCSYRQSIRPHQRSDRHGEARFRACWSRHLLSHRDHDDDDDAHRQWLGHSQDHLSEANIVTGIDPAVLAVMKQEEIEAAKTTSSSGSIPRWYCDAPVSVMLHAVDDCMPIPSCRCCKGYAGPE